MWKKSSILSNYTEGGKIVLTFDFFQIITTKLDLIIDLSSFSDTGKTDNLWQLWAQEASKKNCHVFQRNVSKLPLTRSIINLQIIQKTLRQFILNFCIIECANLTQASDVIYLMRIFLKKNPKTYLIILIDYQVKGVHVSFLIMRGKNNVRCLWVLTMITYILVEKKSLSPSMH